MMFGPFGYGTYGQPGVGWEWMVGGWIMMVVFWGLIIVGIVALVRYAGRGNAPDRSGGSETAAEILRRRYAAGELTTEQFEEMKRRVA